MEFKLPGEQNVLRIHELALQIGGGLGGIIHPERIPAALHRPQTYIDYYDGLTYT